jgi:hypothetical protein
VNLLRFWTSFEQNYWLTVMFLGLFFKNHSFQGVLYIKWAPLEERVRVSLQSEVRHAASVMKSQLPQTQSSLFIMQSTENVDVICFLPLAVGAESQRNCAKILILIPTIIFVSFKKNCCYISGPRVYNLLSASMKLWQGEIWLLPWI